MRYNSMHDQYRRVDFWFVAVLEDCIEESLRGSMQV